MSSLSPYATPAMTIGRTAGAAPPVAVAERLLPLDGLRGLMTLFVMVSHFFGEVPHGISLFCVGWVAVHMFFVLSGFLVGRLVIRKRRSPRFLPVFFLRRATRTLPIYMVCCLGVFLLLGGLGARSWTGTAVALPAWSYLALVQNAFVILRGSAGEAWLAPTWTLALEEQFYLLAPWLFLLVPRRNWAWSLGLIALVGLAVRSVGVWSGVLAIAPLSLLPGCADVLAAGLLLAVLVEEGRIAWDRWGLAFRIAPIACLGAIFVVQRLDPVPGGPMFQILGPALLAAGCASFILTLVHGAPEARRFHAPVLGFFSGISYAVYLTHLPVLGLMHGLVLDARPDVRTLPEIAVTLAAIPVTVALSWTLTRLVEQPLTAWGRRYGWR